MAIYGWHRTALVIHRSRKRPKAYPKLQKRFKRLSPQFWQRRFRPVFQRARYWGAQLRRFWFMNTTFIAVTGSCGKTTTTRLVGMVLSSRGPCYSKYFDNYPSHSVATLLSLPASSRYCVQEVSGHQPGEIAKHVRILRPQIGIVTTVGNDHYKSFRGLEVTAREKGQLVERLPTQGTAILNADDPHVCAMAQRTRAKVLTFGLSPNADVRASEVSSVWPDRLSLTVTYGEQVRHIRTGLVGEHWATAVLAAVACGIACGLDLKVCAEAIERLKRPSFGRNSVHGSEKGPMFVLDTHKATFWTIPSGLAFVRAARAPRKTIVFGTLSDYPGSMGSKYRNVARQALEVANRVVFVGPNSGAVSKLIRDSLRERLFTFQTSYQASAYLSRNASPNELIYIKASRADHLERIMLSQLDQVVCWRERCGLEPPCRGCRRYRKPHAPPSGLADVETSIERKH